MTKLGDVQYALTTIKQFCQERECEDCELHDFCFRYLHGFDLHRVSLPCDWKIYEKEQR